MPVALDRLELVIDKARRAHRLKVAFEYDRPYDGGYAGAHPLYGESPPMRLVKARLTQWLDAETRSGATGPPVVLVGETATGKELVARALHFNGPRRDHAFVKVSVAAIPSALIETELFGREHGAIRGSREDGLVQAAEGGTLFIDGIGDLPRAVQSKLLLLLDDGSVRRVDSLRTRRVDVRVVASTHRQPAGLVSERRLHPGLYSRLADMQLELPPLRERGDDVLLLARHFTALFAARHGKRAPRLSDAAERALESHSWPGNVSELRRILERAVRLDATGLIDAARLRLATDPTHSSHGADINLYKLERDTLLQALERARGNVAHAARLLGITRDTLRYRIAKHQLAAELRSKFRDSLQ
jgi:DNA-binding NtrC family response regulator